MTQPENLIETIRNIIESLSPKDLQQVMYIKPLRELIDDEIEDSYEAGNEEGYSDGHSAGCIKGYQDAENDFTLYNDDYQLLREIIQEKMVCPGDKYWSLIERINERRR